MAAEPIDPTDVSEEVDEATYRRERERAGRLLVAKRVRKMALDIIEDLYNKDKLGASILVPMLQYADMTERLDGSPELDDNAALNGQTVPANKDHPVQGEVGVDYNWEPKELG
jgi:hypothetical protein